MRSKHPSSFIFTIGCCILTAVSLSLAACGSPDAPAKPTSNSKITPAEKANQNEAAIPKTPEEYNKQQERQQLQPESETFDLMQ
ncbi:hypothetical protein [Poriferisphaera sp. WC338]|uniref:hypothetical protein n=1 Tax=Poriferisphaera sp. WC338 TaxID=3425129 RepID=UPI003D814C42